jgi:hypothetical protein
MSIDRALTSLLTARTAALPVAICRIGMGLAMFGRGLKTSRDLYWLQFEPRTVPARLFTWAPQIDTIPEIAVVSILWIAASVGLMVGYRARSSAAILGGCILFLHFVDQNFWAHHMYFLGLMMLLFSLTDSDAAVSVRAWRGDGEAEIAAWPVLLIKIQLSLVYFFTAVSKVNPAFLSGDVLVTRMSLPTTLIPATLIPALAVATVACEMFLAFALWLPRLRVWGALTGVVLHLFVPVLLGSYAGLLVFTLATLSLYVLYVDARDLERLRARFPRLAALVPA